MLFRFGSFVSDDGGKTTVDAVEEREREREREKERKRGCVCVYGAEREREETTKI